MAFPWGKTVHIRQEFRRKSVLFPSMGKTNGKSARNRWRKPLQNGTKRGMMMKNTGTRWQEGENAPAMHNGRIPRGNPRKKGNDKDEKG